MLINNFTLHLFLTKQLFSFQLLTQNREGLYLQLSCYTGCFLSGPRLDFENNTSVSKLSIEDFP